MVKQINEVDLKKGDYLALAIYNNTPEEIEKNIKLNSLKTSMILIT